MHLTIGNIAFVGDYFQLMIYYLGYLGQQNGVFVFESK